MGRTDVALIVSIAVLSTCVPAGGWIEDGHRKVTELAIGLAGTNLPAFFTEGRSLAVASVPDPDLFRERISPELRDQEVPEHYFNIERLGNTSLPSNRYACVALCAQRGINPSDLGFLPYAVTEWTERLTMVLAEHRKWPNDSNIRSKCLVYAGILSHYAADLTQPLHVTIHHDGRALEGSPSPRTGIHARVDGLIGKYSGQNAVTNVATAVYESLWRSVQDELSRTAALVDRVYAMDRTIPALGQPLSDDPVLTGFVRERLDAAAVFTSRLLVTAWIRSAEFALPPWHKERIQAP